MRNRIFALSILLCLAMPAYAQVSISIGINMNSYPDLVQIPGYPVYYDPQVDSNYFFYDGQYWVYRNDNWYSSSWYNGPWGVVGPQYVPLFVLRVPVRYYRDRPSYFRGWRDNDAPRWGDHWGNGWERQRTGWDNWNRHSVPIAAPLPVYQRQYSGHRYPTSVTQQNSIRTANYHYRPQASTPHANVTPQHSQSKARPTQHTPVMQHAPTPIERARHTNAAPQQRQATPAHPEQQRAHAQHQPSAQQRNPSVQHAPNPTQRAQHTNTPPQNRQATPAHPVEQRSPTQQRRAAPAHSVQQHSPAQQQQQQATPSHPVQQRAPAQQRPSAQQRKPPAQTQQQQPKPVPKDKDPDKDDKKRHGPDSH